LAADRSDQGKSTAPGSYAREVLDDLPDFEGSVSTGVRRLRGAPYRTARVEGSGTVKGTDRPQTITVAVYHRAGTVTFTAVVFRNPAAEPPADRRVLERMLRTFRAGVPR
jgi:hypothetical protein